MLKPDEVQELVKFCKVKVQEDLVPIVLKYYLSQNEHDVRNLITKKQRQGPDTSHSSIAGITIFKKGDLAKVTT